MIFDSGYILLNIGLKSIIFIAFLVRKSYIFGILVKNEYIDIDKCIKKC